MGGVQLLNRGVVGSAEPRQYAWTERLEVRKRAIQRSRLHVIVNAQILIRIELMIKAQRDLVIPRMTDRDGLVVVVGATQVAAGWVGIRARDELQEVDGDRIKAVRWNLAGGKHSSPEVSRRR